MRLVRSHNVVYFPVCFLVVVFVYLLSSEEWSSGGGFNHVNAGIDSTLQSFFFHRCRCSYYKTDVTKSKCRYSRRLSHTAINNTSEKNQDPHLLLS